MNQENGNKKGYVYILVNPAFTGFVKIGKTIKEPEERARQLSSGSGVPAPYAVAWDAFVYDCDHVEKLIHQQLANSRSRNDREFFSIPLKHAISIASSIVTSYSCEVDAPFSNTSVAVDNVPCSVAPPIKIPRNYCLKTYHEELIEVAEDCPVKCAIEPPVGDPKTIARIGYEVLIENPYKFTEREFFKEVHFERRQMLNLKVESYNIKRSLIVRAYGWGIHRNQDGKLALVPMESAQYKELQESIKTTKSYRTRKNSSILEEQSPIIAIKNNSSQIKNASHTLFRQNDNPINGGGGFYQLSGCSWNNNEHTRNAIVYFSRHSKKLVIIPAIIVNKYIFEPYFKKALTGYILREEYKGFELTDKRISLQFKFEQDRLLVTLKARGRTRSKPLFSLPKPYWPDVDLNETNPVACLIDTINKLCLELSAGEGIMSM